MIQNPKTFFEQFQNFIEESGLQLKKFKSNLSNYFTKSEAIDTFLGKTDQAESAKKADEAIKTTQDSEGNVISSTYLKTNTASTTYLTQANASSTYLTKTGKASSASKADTAGSATKATQDAKGNVIDSTYLTKSDATSTYLTKTGKAASATNADTATKASQDLSGNEITTTYLKKVDAESTYLGKTAKAESAKSADAATKAIQDGNGKNIANTYATIASLTTTNTNVTNAQTTANQAKSSADAKVAISGNRGQLAGYETPAVTANAVTINADFNDTTQVTGAVEVTVATGVEGTSWTKTVSLVNASATITLGDSWVWSGGEVPTVNENGILVLHWCNDIGVANLVEGGVMLRTYIGTVTNNGDGADIWRKDDNGEMVQIGEIASGAAGTFSLAVGDRFRSSAGDPWTSFDVDESNGVAVDEYGDVISVSDGFTLTINPVADGNLGGEAPVDPV